MRDSRLSRQSGVDQSCRRWSLKYAVGAGTAGIFWATSDDDTELRGNDIQPLRHVPPIQCRPPPQLQIRLSGSMISSTRGRWAGRDPRLAACGLACGLPGAQSASSSAWTAAMAVSRSSSARSNCSGSAYSDLRPKAACFKAATSFSNRSIRSSLRASHACDAISIAFRAAISSGRSTASNIEKVNQIWCRHAAGICEPSDRDAPTRLPLTLLPQQSELAASRGPQTAPQTAHVRRSLGHPEYLAR